MLRFPLSLKILRTKQRKYNYFNKTYDKSIKNISYQWFPGEKLWL